MDRRRSRIARWLRSDSCPRSDPIRSVPDRSPDPTGPGPALDGAAVVRMLGRAHARVADHQDWLDELNVFPIADADSGRNMKATLAAVQEAAEASVARTPSLLPVLARHGVVDAGGVGLLCVLDGFVLALGGDAPEARGPAVPRGAGAGLPTGDRVEVMVTVEGTADQVERIEGAWRELGDSIAVAGLDDLWRLHVHTDRPDAAIAVAEASAAVVDRAVEPLVEETP